MILLQFLNKSSNNTNKFNPQEHRNYKVANKFRSNNTNKFNPQERMSDERLPDIVQIIQINSILKNRVGEPRQQKEFK